MSPDRHAKEEICRKKQGAVPPHIKPLSRRKPGSTHQALVRSNNGSRLCAGTATPQFHPLGSAKPVANYKGRSFTKADGLISNLIKQIPWGAWGA
jgi:hypothetical protein